MPGETAVLVTVLVAERDQCESAEITNLGRVLQLNNCTIPAFV
jgi:hypothetical protein